MHAQKNPNSYIDIVQLTSGRDAKGKILEYVHGEKVVLLAIDGDLEEFEWRRIKRIRFKVDSYYDRKGDKTNNHRPSEVIVAEETPQRNWFHDVTVGGLFGVQPTRFGGSGNDRIMGYGISYAHIRRYKRLRYGAGVDYAVYHYRRGETSLALTAVGELPFLAGGNPKVAPYLRLAAGPAVPTGVPNSDDNITGRSIGIMVHPTAGIEFKTSRNDFNNLFIDLGYRFLNSQFTVTTSTLDVLERNVDYSRFSFRVGYRF